MEKIFLLSPASTSGRRAQLLFNERAAFPLAVSLRRKRGAPLGEIFSFLSGLYFRGKLAYSEVFAKPTQGVEPIQVITSNRGLLTPAVRMNLDDLRALAHTPIDSQNREYRVPFERDARALAEKNAELHVVLLGSIASGKYCDVLLDIFGDRLLFPLEFVGRGDMSRGGLMLRCVDTMTELTYVPVSGAVRRGKRPPRLDAR